MAEGLSPANSPPAPPPPSPSSGEESSPPPPPSSSTPPSQSPPTAPPPQQDQSSSPPPPPPPPSPENSSGGSSSAPAPSNSASASPPPPAPPPPKGSNGNNNNNNNNGSNNNGREVSTPPPPKGSERGSNSPEQQLAPPRSGGSSNSSGDNGIDMSQIIAVAVGAGLLLLVIVLCFVCCCRKRKKKKKSQLDQQPYYGSNAYTAGKVGGDHQYYNGVSAQQHQHYNNQNVDHHMVNLPPPPGQYWPPISSPPPPLMSGPNGNSSDISSSYSGPHGPSLPPPHPSVALGFNQSTFTYDELAMATQGFAQDRLLGQGGFGYVHKGILPNGKEVAVKSLKVGSGQGEREFQAEVEIISRVHHRHLVSLVGYCIAGTQRMLVYEFLPNDTLEFHLHGNSGSVMDWPTRLKIALGSAKGLAYLHEDCHPKIIHRDIKGPNILLDNNFEAKVADFGLAKLSQDNNTHVSTRVMGTFGYLAPEYASSGKLTDKSDVFSFGVMLLELVTGRKPVDLTGEMEDSLVDWARPLCMKAAEDGEYGELADPRLENRYAPHEMARMVACAAAATRHSARRRPKMSQIVRALEGDASLDDLNEGVKPGQSSFFGSGSGGGSSDYDAGSYGADMRKLRQLALDSRNDFGASSEYGATSEYGLHPSSSSSDDMGHAGTTAARHSPAVPSRGG